MKRGVYNPQKRQKIISITALASYFGVHRHTMKKKITDTGTDLCNIYSLLDFVKKHATDSPID